MGDVRTLSFHETNEWHPSVLGDGRIVYTRWDYVDRSAAHYHGLWVSHPDGTGPRVLFGNYTRRINACYQPRAIPGSNRVVFVAGAHHAAVGGSLVVVDPTRTALDPFSSRRALRPVGIELRHGVQEGLGTYAWANRTPSRAFRSNAGVLTAASPYAPA